MWTATDLLKLFHVEGSTRTPIYYAEETKEIPPSTLVPRGKIKVKKWATADLPKIGEKFGFLKKPENQHVICIYTPKGGVFKTTVASNLARILAINGIKVIACGMDFQKSLTRSLLPKKQLNQDLLDEAAQKPLGLYHMLFENASLSEVVQHTDLPTLDVIPETSDLNFMAKKMRLENRREYIFKEKLLPKLSDYDVVIFDCNPNWTDLCENSLVAASTVIMPIACEAECNEALEENLEEINEFQRSMRIQWDNWIMIPTNLNSTTVSQGIYAKYLTEYKEVIIPYAIRYYIAAQEARIQQLSIMEYEAKSNLANDYYNIIRNLWAKINNYTLEEDEVVS